MAKLLDSEVAESWEDAYDDDLDETLNEVLEKFNVCESSDKTLVRREVLKNFEMKIDAWILKVSQIRRREPSGTMKTFGSFGMGVNSPGGDMDVVAIVPAHIMKADFFRLFVAMLKKDDNVECLEAVEDAFVPIIKLKYFGFDLDVLFARTTFDIVPDNINKIHDEELEDMDEESVRSLNGYRLAVQILELVGNKESFRTALRTVKLWAKKKGINSCALGFFGGVTLAILMARTCQSNPEATPSQLVFEFFAMFSSWDWQNPVHLRGTDYWFCYRYPSDIANGMTILTPTNPVSNTTYNVSKFTKNILVQELKEGFRVCKMIDRQECCWDKLFEEAKFFKKYSRYICLMLAAETKNDELRYAGFLEAKIRHLSKILEKNPSISASQVNPKKFTPLSTARFDMEMKYPVCILWFIGVEFRNAVEKNQLEYEFKGFKSLLHQHGGTSKGTKGVVVLLQLMNQEELSQFISFEDLGEKRPYKKKTEVVERLSIENTSTASSTSTSSSELASETNSLERTYANIVSNSSSATRNQTEPETKTWADIVSSPTSDKSNHN